MAIYWPTPGYKGRTFKLCVLTRWDFNFCIAAPHCGCWVRSGHTGVWVSGSGVRVTAAPKAVRVSNRVRSDQWVTRCWCFWRGKVWSLTDHCPKAVVGSWWSQVWSHWCLGVLLLLLKLLEFVIGSGLISEWLAVDVSDGVRSGHTGVWVFASGLWLTAALKLSLQP